jgi:polyphosphate kinase 2
MSIVKTYEEWYTNSTEPSLDIKYDFDDGENEEINIDKKSVINFINQYKKSFSKGLEVVELKGEAKEDFGGELYMLLELESFFNNLKVKERINRESALEYFDDYISDIPRIFRKIRNDYSNYNLDDKFSKLKELKKQKKKQRKKSKEIFNTEKDALFIELLKMVEWIKKTKQRILVTVDGRDSAGKGSFIKFVEENTPEKIVNHTWFDIPTDYDQENWFDRYEKEFPKDGNLRFFDRSWYNRAVNDPVNGYCTEEQYKKFMKDVIPFESKLIDDGIIYVKFWFSIDKKTQQFRFNLRKAHPLKYWKFSPSDAKAVERYDLFTFYKEQMFVKTSTEKSPWVVVNMNDKKLGQLNALRYILSKVPYPNKNEDIIVPYKTKVFEV